MKRISLFAAIAVFLAASCAKEAPLKEQGDSEVLKVSVSLQNALKTDLQKVGSIYKVVWKEGDCLYLNGVKSAPLSAADAGSGNATFTFDGVFSAPYYFSYGADGEISVPFNQVLASDGCVSNFVIPMSATTSSTSVPVNLQPACSVLRIALSGEGVVRSVAVQAEDGEMLSRGCNCVALRCAVSGEGVPLSFDTKDFYVAVPAGTYSKGLNTYVILSDGKTMKLTAGSASGLTLASGKVYEFAERTFAENVDDLLIATPEDLVAFSAMSGESYRGTVARLICNLDMTGVEYKPFSYCGGFEGNHHTISGMKNSLFTTLYGYVKDFTIESDYYHTSNTYGAGLVAQYIYCYISNDSSKGASGAYADNIITKGNLKVKVSTSHAFQAGALFGASNGCPVTNCTNFADVYIENVTTSGTSSSGYLWFGGVIGTLQTKTAELKNLTNYGKVTVASAKGTDVGAGGVVAYHNIAKATSNLLNCGDVTIESVTSTGPVRLGGVVGYIAKDTTHDYLINEGNLVAGKATSAGTYVYYGGIAGYSFSIISNSANEGSLTLGLSAKNNITYGGIVGRTGGDKTGDRFINCTNNGKLTVTSDFNPNGKTLYIAGIAGHMQSGTFKSCVNTGDIEVNNTTPCSLVKLGGISGESANVCSGTADAPCLNTGNLSIANGASTNDVQVGGIFGSEVTAGGTLSYCISKCNIDVPASTAVSAVVGRTTQALVFDNVGISGTVNGVTLSADNFKTYFCAKAEGTAPTINDNCYFYTK